MEHVDIANRAEVVLGELESLVRGAGTANVANRFGLNIADIDDFIKGGASAANDKVLRSDPNIGG